MINSASLNGALNEDVYRRILSFVNIFPFYINRSSFPSIMQRHVPPSMNTRFERLRTCLLVSRMFYRIARSFLLSDISFGDADDVQFYINHTAYDLYPPHSISFTVAEFNTLADLASLMQAVPRVKRLVIVLLDVAVTTWVDTWDAKHDQMWRMAGYRDGWLDSSWNELTHNQYLPDSFDFSDLSPSLLCNIQELRVRNPRHPCDIVISGWLGDVCQGNPSLKAITLDGIVTPSRQFGLSFGPSRLVLLGLNSVRISDADLASIVEVCQSTLKGLILGVMVGTSLDGVHKALQPLKHKIIALKLDFRINWERKCFNEQLDGHAQELISIFTNLSCLHVAQTRFTHSFTSNLPANLHTLQLTDYSLAQILQIDDTVAKFDLASDNFHRFLEVGMKLLVIDSYRDQSLPWEVEFDAACRRASVAVERYRMDDWEDDNFRRLRTDHFPRTKVSCGFECFDLW